MKHVFSVPPPKVHLTFLVCGEQQGMHWSAAQVTYCRPTMKLSYVYSVLWCVHGAKVMWQSFVLLHTHLCWKQRTIPLVYKHECLHESTIRKGYANLKAGDKNCPVLIKKSTGRNWQNLLRLLYENWQLFMSEHLTEWQNCNVRIVAKSFQILK